MRTPARLGLLGSLYFSQGLPFGFFTQALPVLLRREHLSLGAIGLTSLLALPWSLKALWAPLVDRYGSARFGRRRSWILPLQLGAAGTALGLATLEPSRGRTVLFAAVALTNLLAATQDIATDALAIELLPPSERGLGNGVQVAGYRVGMILGGGALLGVFEQLGWARAFCAIAAALLLATVPIALYREPPAQAPAQAPGAGPYRTAATAPALALALRFFRRPGIAAWLALLLVYKLGDALASGMVRPFLVDRGVTLAQIAVISGTVGFSAGLIGALLGGALVQPLGRRRALVLFGALQSVSVASYVWMALAPRGFAALCAVAGFEHLCSGMGTATLFTVMMDVCRREATATDYTVQSCAVVLATGLASTVSGFLAQAVGYAALFAIATALAAAGAVYAWAAYASAQAALARGGEALS